MTTALEMLHQAPLGTFMRRQSTPVELVQHVYGDAILALSDTWCCARMGLRQDGAVAILRTDDGLTGIYVPEHGDPFEWQRMSTGNRIDAIDRAIRRPLVTTTGDLLALAEECVLALGRAEIGPWSLQGGEKNLSGWRDVPLYSPAWLLRLALIHAAPTPADRDGAWTMLALSTETGQAQAARDLTDTLDLIAQHQNPEYTASAERLMLDLIHEQTGVDMTEADLWRTSTPAALLALPDADWEQEAQRLVTAAVLLLTPETPDLEPDPAGPSEPDDPRFAVAG